MDKALTPILQTPLFLHIQIAHKQVTSALEKVLYSSCQISEFQALKISK